MSAALKGGRLSPKRRSTPIRFITRPPRRACARPRSTQRNTQHPGPPLPREARKTSTAVTPAAPLLADDDFGKELINWLFPAYVTLIVLCVFLFLSRGAMAQGHEMSFDR